MVLMKEPHEWSPQSPRGAKVRVALLMLDCGDRFMGLTKSTSEWSPQSPRGAGVHEPCLCLIMAAGYATDEVNE